MNTTVDQLAKLVGIPSEQLLKKMAEAGIIKNLYTDVVTDEEKQRLLQHIRGGTSDIKSGPAKVTLTRKSTSTLKVGASAGTKSVNVEVRKKRTYVHRETQPETERKKVIEREESDRRKKEENLRLEEEKKIQQEEKRRVQLAEEERIRKEQVAHAAELKKPSLPLVPPEEPLQLEPGRLSDNRKRQRDDKKRDDQLAPKRIGRTTRREVAKRPVAYLAGEEETLLRYRPKKKPGKAAEEIAGHKFEKPAVPVVREVTLSGPITVAELAGQMAIKSAELIKTLMSMGTMATINQVIDQDTAILSIEELGHKARILSENAIEQEMIDTFDLTGDQKPRPPVVTVMGHVDHGKTSLLDFIRKSRVAIGEAGGITQHIGAYNVSTNSGSITFIDTPGHAAFTNMRARGAQVTDVVILVVAADDGVMPQTEEAVQHAKSADVPLVVAINKIDKPEADLDRVKNELAGRDVIPEEWGGDTQFIPVSAATGEGIDSLLEAVILQAELLELMAVYEGSGRGVVIESRLDRGRGPVATVLVKNGLLKVGDAILVGQQVGKARALINENGEMVKIAGPSVPVEVLGLSGTPDSGDDFMVLETEKKAREVAAFRQNLRRETEHKRQQATKLDQMFANMETGGSSSLKIVLKTDVRGTLEALSSALNKLSMDEVKVQLISAGVGGITETDATLASSAGAALLGFNVRADNGAKVVIERDALDLRYYSVIYDIIDDVKKAMSGLLEPELREEIVGIAEVRDVFNSPKYGQIAGCMVIEGTIFRSKKIRVLRENIVIYEGELESLRRFKDDVNEVRNGIECGIGVKNYTEVKEMDKIEVFDVKSVAREL